MYFCITNYICTSLCRCQGHCLSPSVRPDVPFVTLCSTLVSDFTSPIDDCTGTLVFLPLAIRIFGSYSAAGESSLPNY